MYYIVYFYLYQIYINKNKLPCRLALGVEMVGSCARQSLENVIIIVNLNNKGLIMCTSIYKNVCSENIWKVWRQMPQKLQHSTCLTGG